MYLLDYINSFYLEDDSTVIIKMSKTELLLRIFVDASNKENFNAISQELSSQTIQMGVLENNFLFASKTDVRFFYSKNIVYNFAVERSIYD